MARHNEKYGYVMALWELVDSAYIDQEDSGLLNCGIRSERGWYGRPVGVDPPYFPRLLRPLLYMELFRSTEYLDADGGFYYERWGDASVHSLAAALLLEPAQLHHFADFGYQHATFQYCPYLLPNGQIPDVTKTTDEQRRAVGCRCKCNGDFLYPRPICLNKIKSTVL